VSVLILGANTASPITVVVQTAGEGAPQEVGTVTQSFIAADRSSVRGVKRNYSSLSTIVDTATKDSIINLLKWGNQIPCSGDLLANIQTQCTVRYLGCRMIPGLGGSFWEVGLSLSEVQSNVTLLRYAPGDTITGESFTRASSAYYINSVGTLVSVGNNVKRDSHYIGGVRSVLLEDTRTNAILQSTAFNNVAWTKTNITVTTGIADPAGATNACTLTATLANGFVQQSLAAGSSVVRTNSFWLRRRTGTGTISIQPPDGSSNQVVTLTGTWTRFSASNPSASTVRTSVITIATNGDAIDVWNAQMEDGAFGTSDIPTTTTAGTRAADNYSFPFTYAPQEMSVYAKFVEAGTIKTSGSRIADFTIAADTDPRFVLFNVGTLYESFHHNGSAAVSSALGVAPVIGDVVELDARLFGDGSTDVTQSINAAAATSSTQSGRQLFGLPTAWSAQLVWLNSGGTSGWYGFAAFQSFKVIAGTRSLSEMRAA
jgi:hypothetical protein